MGGGTSQISSKYILRKKASNSAGAGQYAEFSQNYFWPNSCSESETEPLLYVCRVKVEEAGWPWSRNLFITLFSYHMILGRGLLSKHGLVFCAFRLILLAPAGWQRCLCRRITWIEEPLGFLLSDLLRAMILLCLKCKATEILQAILLLPSSKNRLNLCPAPSPTIVCQATLDKLNRSSVF